MKTWTGVLALLAGLVLTVNPHSAEAQAIVDGSGLSVAGGGVYTDHGLRLDDVAYNAMPADLWLVQSDGMLQSTDSEGNCTVHRDWATTNYAVAVFGGRLWIGQSNGHLQSCDSSGECTDHGGLGGGILSMAVFQNQLWLGHFGGRLSSCDSSGICTDRGWKGDNIKAMVAYDGRLWIGLQDGRLKTCNAFGACTDRGDEGAAILTMGVYASRLWIGQQDGTLKSCDNSGTCINHGDKGDAIHGMTPFDGLLWIGQEDGSLRACGHTGVCINMGDKGSRLQALAVFNGRLWIGEFLGQLLACDTTGMCTDHGDQGALITAMAVYEGASLSHTLYTRGGKAGVRTTAPSHTLTVNGQVAIQQYAETKYHIDYYNGGLNFAETGVSDYRLFIEDGGNVGIGTGNPGYRLDVNGNIITRGDIRRDGSSYSHPDYVFAPGYALSSLPEVESYITRNRCLPGMPSAADVERDGVELVEQSRLMIEKLEELYLHLIGLDMQISTLETVLVH